MLLILTSQFGISQMEPINIGHKAGFEEYIETFNEFTPKNHPGSGAQEQIIWRINDNIYIYGNANGNFDYGTSAFWVYNMTIKQWKCIQPMVTEISYGTKGVFSATNSPGPRKKSTTFSDAAGNLYLFGGSYLNDLWKFDISLNQWAWIGGDQGQDGFEGIPGPVGVESNLYFPSIRRDVKPSIGPDGMIYIYGGYADTWDGYIRSDLWRYNPTNNAWTLIYNRVVANNSVSGQNIAAMGAENVNNHPGRLSHHTSWFYNNSLYTFGGTPFYTTDEDGYYNQVWKYNLTTQQWACLKNPSGTDALYGEQLVSNANNTPPRLQSTSTAVTIGNEAYFFGGREIGGDTSDLDNRGLHSCLWKFNMTTNEWTWMKGRTIVFNPGFYGKKGIEREENLPASQANSFLWVDNGIIKMYGGKTSAGNLIEFWKYDPSSNNFTWIDGKGRTFVPGYQDDDDEFIEDASVPLVYNKLKGSELQWGQKSQKLWHMLVDSGMWEYDIVTSTNHLIIADPTGVGHYGQQGVAAPENIPPYRADGLLWETNSSLYLMSGRKNNVHMNDFWIFDKATKMWTWLNGAPGQETPYFQYGAIGEVNSSNYPKSRTNGQAWVDADENLWLFSGTNGQSYYMNDFWKYDASINTWILMGGDANNATSTAAYYIDTYPPFVIDAACWSAGNNLYFYGGQGLARSQTSQNLTTGRLSDVWKYSIGSNTWTRVNGNRKQNMLANYGVLQYGFTSNLPGSRQHHQYWSDDFGNFWMYGGMGEGEVEATESYLFDFWKYDISLNMWIWMDGPKNPLNVFDGSLDAYDWNAPATTSFHSPVFKGNGKYYLMFRSNTTTLWEVSIAGYPGNYNMIDGYARFDSNGDCDPTDTPIANLKLDINNIGAQFYTNLEGYYKIYTPQLNNTLQNTGLIQNNSFFNVTPSSHTINFTTFNDSQSRNFCASPNGAISDLDVTIIPLTEARPGVNSRYKIIYKNKGNTTLSGNVAFNYNDDLADFVSATINPDTQSVGQLTWSYSDLAPFDFNSFEVTLNINTPTEAPPVNGGDILEFTSVINPTADDYTLADNTFTLSQAVVNSLDPNDKTCLQGTTIEEEMVGEYLTYLIRFENTGNATAQNITVTDFIDISKFAIESIEAIDSSHPFRMTVTEGNRVDFLFENIDLPFSSATDDGYIAFRIRTLPDLEPGETVSNAAAIYFDYNSAVDTNNYITSIEGELNAEDFAEENLMVYPNPVKNNLYFNGSASITKISVYDIAGRILSTASVTGNTADLSALARGVYIIKAFSTDAAQSFKIVKE